MVETKMDMLNPSDLQAAWNDVQEAKTKFLSRNIFTNQIISQLSLLTEPVNIYFEKLQKLNDISSAIKSLNNFQPTWNTYSTYVRNPSNFFNFSSELAFFSNITSIPDSSPLKVSIIETRTALNLFLKNIHEKKDYSETPSIVPLSFSVGSLAKADDISIKGLKEIISSLQKNICNLYLY